MSMTETKREGRDVTLRFIRYPSMELLNAEVTNALCFIQFDSWHERRLREKVDASLGLKLKRVSLNKF
jgi:hypothetical protein